MEFEPFFALMKQQLGTLSTASLDHVDARTPLLATGLIDSLAIVDLISFVEARWGVQVDPMDLSVDNFGSIGAIHDYVRRKIDGVA